MYKQMEARTSRSTSQGTTFHSHFQRSLSPSGRFCSSSISTSSTASTFATRPERFLPRSTSPTRVTLGRSVSPSSSSVRFSAPRTLPGHHRPLNSSTRNHHHNNNSNSTKKTCMCSPTTHPGSFRCSLHKNTYQNSHNTAPYQSRSSGHQLNMRRSAMTNSLVRIGTVEGDLVTRALTALIRPSSHSLRRRHDFQPRPSRLWVMSKADDVL